MPRLSNSLLRQARATNPLIATLLRTCRTIESAQNEFRWLQQHVSKLGYDQPDRKNLLQKLCFERGRGKPLQYILGTEYFGELELRCKPGVLIPRPETAVSVTYLVKRLSRAWTNTETPSLRVLDLCTGSGCMSLLFHHEARKMLRRSSFEILGIDLSSRAIALAKQNRDLSIPESDRSNVEFLQADVLQSRPNALESPSTTDDFPESRTALKWDIVISNPPYISPAAFFKTTASSVRAFEPRLALVPPDNTEDVQQADTFYPHILRTAMLCNANVVLVEVADLAQALRVVSLSKQDEFNDRWNGVEIWRDDPDYSATNFVPGNSTETGQAEPDILFRGRGEGRSVLLWDQNAIKLGL